MPVSIHEAKTLPTTINHSPRSRNTQVLNGLKQCTLCRKLLPSDHFYKYNTKAGLSSWCKKCYGIRRKKYHQEYQRKNREKLLVHAREWGREKIKQLRHDVLEYISDGVIKCKKCGYSSVRALQIDHIHGGGTQEFKKRGTYSRYKVILRMSKEEVYNKYQILCANCNWIKKSTTASHSVSNIWLRAAKHVDDKLECNHCGFSDIRGLQIDHIYGNGLQEIRKYGGGFQMFHAILQMPKGVVYEKYQILCSNCNWIKRFENKEYSYIKTNGGVYNRK